MRSANTKIVAGATVLIRARKEHKGGFTAEAQRTRMFRREEERQRDKWTRKQGALILGSSTPISTFSRPPALSSPPRFLCVLRASAVNWAFIAGQSAHFRLRITFWAISRIAISIVIDFDPILILN